MSIGVIIPVYRGAAVLSRSVGSLARQVSAPHMHVVIAVNDQEPTSTAAAYRGAELLAAKGVRCDVLRTAVGRFAALNEAEAALPDGPRLYVDQDAQLSNHAVAELAALLAPGTHIHFAAPALQRDRMREPWTTRHYFDAWQQLPYVAQSPVTAGVYAVSAEGRRRWGAFPALHSDDKYARLHFSPPERRTAVGCYYDVLLPAGVCELVRARRRCRQGNRELAGLLEDAARAPDLPRHTGILRAWLRHPRTWASAAVLLAVDGVAAARRAGPT